MSIHEQKKVCKIIDELTLYLLKKGYEKVEISVDYKDNSLTKIVFTTDILKKEIVEKLKKYISLKRENEVEEYGWELLGESDNASDLEMIGLLVDNIIIEENEGKSKIILSRKY